MGKANFSEEFKRDAVAQITERGYWHTAVHGPTPLAEHFFRKRTGTSDPERNLPSPSGRN